jgi:hypothetical protein
LPAPLTQCHNILDIGVGHFLRRAQRRNPSTRRCARNSVNFAEGVRQFAGCSVGAHGARHSAQNRGMTAGGMPADARLIHFVSGVVEALSVGFYKSEVVHLIISCCGYQKIGRLQESVSLSPEAQSSSAAATARKSAPSAHAWAEASLMDSMSVRSAEARSGFGGDFLVNNDINHSDTSARLPPIFRPFEVGTASNSTRSPTRGGVSMARAKSFR